MSQKTLQQKDGACFSLLKNNMEGVSPRKKKSMWEISTVEHFKLPEQQIQNEADDIITIP